jgi:hypothetical protein
MNMIATDLRSELANFYGTEQWYKHMFGLLYTDGVKYFAEKAGAYWLLDIVDTEIKPLLKREGFLDVQLIVAGTKAIIAVGNGNGGTDLFRRDIPFTDCPEGVWRFYLTDNVLLLPSEY